MKIPSFPECNHPLVQQLGHLSDRELLERFKAEPEAGRYFTAVFCRYSPVVYTLVGHSARSPVQADYLFALTWRHILNELGGLTLPEAEETQAAPLTLQSWLINVTALCINQAVLPDVEDIHYSLPQASPPLWCYVERALDQLVPLERLVVVMTYTFCWSPPRIAAYLQAEGEQISPAEVTVRVRRGAEALKQALPEDIRAIYLNQLGAELENSALPALMTVSPEAQPMGPVNGVSILEN